MEDNPIVVGVSSTLNDDRTAARLMLRTDKAGVVHWDIPVGAMAAVITRFFSLNSSLQQLDPKRMMPGETANLMLLNVTNVLVGRGENGQLGLIAETAEQIAVPFLIPESIAKSLVGLLEAELSNPKPQSSQQPS